MPRDAVSRTANVEKISLADIDASFQKSIIISRSASYGCWKEAEKKRKNSCFGKQITNTLIEKVVRFMDIFFGD